MCNQSLKAHDHLNEEKTFRNDDPTHKPLLLFFMLLLSSHVGVLTWGFWQTRQMVKTGGDTDGDHFCRSVKIITRTLAYLFSFWPCYYPRLFKPMS